jgi:hypothetical protein
MLQNPETKKKAKYHLPPLAAAAAATGGSAAALGETASFVVGMVSVLTGDSFSVIKLEPFGWLCLVANLKECSFQSRRQFQSTGTVPLASW